MEKLTLAHEYAKMIVSLVDNTIDHSEFASICFDYAEAMLAEEEKRKDKSRPDVIEKVDMKTADWVNELVNLHGYPDFDISVNYNYGAKVVFDNEVISAKKAKILYKNSLRERP